jgi:hypothetical protein
MKMKSIKSIIIVSCLFCIALLSACHKITDTTPTIKGGGAPPKTWQEHWFEHNSLLTRVFYNDDLALYYDDKVDTKVTWPNKEFTNVWQYVKKTYGGFGDSSRLYVVLHQGLYPGEGHPASYFDVSHDYRNTLDVGAADWTNINDNLGVPIHEIGHIVCGANNGVQGSPSDAIWGDSKFMEIFIYDVLMHTGHTDVAANVYQEMKNQDPNLPFPGKIYPNVRWFENWFYPIYSKYGQAEVLSRYFALLSKNFPQTKNSLGHQYTRDLKFGEFIHFWSGAAGVNLKAQATIAFGWSMEREQELKNAQEDFPNVKYNY